MGSSNAEQPYAEKRRGSQDAPSGKQKKEQNTGRRAQLRKLVGRPDKGKPHGEERRQTEKDESDAASNQAAPEGEKE